ncbi:MAG TPA: glycosyltransferase family 39 protein [Candidatus Nanoarchaeia archaeon]|nr:glycosyltransferase family 39 protein [Candidatus Nanoarchaeia archaeon]
MNKKHRLLIAVILIGVFLRVFNLGTESIWTDEAVSLIEATQPSFNDIASMVADKELLPYGYHLILHYWIDLFGISEFTIRFLSALFSTASILILFLLTRKVFSDKTAFLAALLMSTAMLEIVYAQEARPYALFGFLALLSTLFLVYFVNEQKKRHLAAYGFVTLIALYINYMALFLILFQSLVFIKYRKQWKAWLTTQITLFILFLPLIPFMVGQALNKYPAWVNALPKFGVPEFLSKLGVFFFALPVLLFLAIAFFLVIFIKIKKIPFNATIFFIALIALALIIFSSLSIIMRPLSLVRHSFFLVPLIYVAIAWGIFQLKKHKTACIVAILIFNLITLTIYYVTPTKPEWRQAASYISDRSTYPAVIFNARNSDIYIFSYYLPDAKALSLEDSDISQNIPPDFWYIAAKSNEFTLNYSIMPAAAFSGVTVYRHDTFI